MDAMQLQDSSFPGIPPFIISKIRNLPSGSSADQILQAIRMSEQNLIDLGNISVLSLNSQLGVLWIITLSTHMKTMPRITGRWEDVIWKISELIFKYMAATRCISLMLHDINVDSLESTALKPWVLSMLSDPELCPNPYLRLEMLRHIGIWPEEYIRDTTSGMQAAAGLVSTSAYMKLDHLITTDTQSSFLFPLKMVLKSLNKWGHLDAVAAAAADQLRKLKVGPEASFFNHMLGLLNARIETVLAEFEARKKSAKNIFSTLSLLKEMFDVYGLLMVTAPTGPGMAQVAATFLVTVTASILKMPSESQIFDDLFLDFSIDFIRHLVAGIDDIYQKISVHENFSYFYHILKFEHAHYLSSLSKQASDFGLFHHLPVPCQESLKEVPEEFKDNVTQAVMEAPVLLNTSKMVIDESTLVRLLLESPSDPLPRLLKSPAPPPG